MPGVRSRPAATTVTPADPAVEMASVQLHASSVEPARMTAAVIRGWGMGDESVDVRSVLLVEDINANGLYDIGYDAVIAQGTYATDDPTLTLPLSRTIPPGTTAQWLLVYEMSGSALPDATFQASLELSSEGSTSRADLGSATVQGEAATVASAGSVAGSITLSSVAVPAVAPIRANAQNVLMLALDVSASAAENLLVRQLRFRSTGTGNEAQDVFAAYLWRDADGDGAFSAQDELLARVLGPFATDPTESAFDLSSILLAGRLERWFITYDFGGWADARSTFQVSVEDPSSALAADGTTSFLPAVVSGGPAVGPVVEVADTTQSASSSKKRKGGGCGLLGIESLLFLALLKAAGRRRRSLS